MISDVTGYPSSISLCNTRVIATTLVVIPIHHPDIGIEKLLLGNMVLIDVGDLAPVDRRQGARGLRRPQITAITEGRGHIAEARGPQKVRRGVLAGALLI